MVQELEALGKPFVILLNSTHPDAPETRALAAELEQSYGRSVLAVSCVDLDAAALGEHPAAGAVRVSPVRGENWIFAPPRWRDACWTSGPLAADGGVRCRHGSWSERVSRMKDLSARRNGRSCAGLRGRAADSAVAAGMNLCRRQSCG